MNEIVQAAISIGAREWRPASGPARYYIPDAFWARIARARFEAQDPVMAGAWLSYLRAAGARSAVYVDAGTGQVVGVTKLPQPAHAERMRAVAEAVAAELAALVAPAAAEPAAPATDAVETPAPAGAAAEFASEFAAKYGGEPTPEQAARLLEGMDQALRRAEPVWLGDRALSPAEVDEVRAYLARRAGGR